jgi:hypothetical protein
MIHLKSYIGVNELRFGQTESAAIACFGPPKLRTINSAGEIELDFDLFALKFDQANKQFRECTLLPGCVSSINGTPVIWDQSFLHWMQREDGELKELQCFILSFRLGIAASGFHDGDLSQRAIHAFRQGDWEMFMERMIPFRMKNS